MEWLVPLLLLAWIGSAAGRDAWRDKSPRDPVARRRMLVPRNWWTHRYSPRERMRGHVHLKAGARK